MRPVEPLLDTTVVLSAGAALAFAPRVLRRDVRPGRGGAFGPEAALAVVVALILVNQLAFAVYVNRVHGGDISFVARYLPAGWFDVPRIDLRVPAAELLAPSVLRVQAFLELPLVLLAFAAVLRRLDRALYARVARSPLVVMAAVSYTAAFCAVEWDLRNPYTVDDLVLRVLSAVVTPPLIRRLAAREDGTDRPPRSLALFALDLWAYGQLMLVLYDTVLLYNLARLGDHLPSAAAALAVLVATRLVPAHLGPRIPAPLRAGPHVTALRETIERALALFLVPALAIRYAGSFGTPQLAALAALVILAPAITGLRLALPAAVGAAAGYVIAAVAPGPYYEAAVLRSATGALLATTAVCALLDTSRARLDVPP
ncbi:hypothetical protein [Kitasatospora sp. NPDC093558]|uniref:hypothetical protein n=1 Tax=Kitasatospora sp. NPDC093558 TaxID=3155201 RepID=UPI00343B98DD